MNKNIRDDITVLTDLDDTDYDRMITRLYIMLTETPPSKLVLDVTAMRSASNAVASTIWLRWTMVNQNRVLAVVVTREQRTRLAANRVAELLNTFDDVEAAVAAVTAGTVPPVTDSVEPQQVQEEVVS